ncbi:hypothetical protein ACQVA2_22115 (plasmid) [Citrobacter sp. OP27]
MNKKLIITIATLSTLLLIGCGDSKQEKCTKLRNEANQSIFKKGSRSIRDIREDWNNLQCKTSDIIPDKNKDGIKVTDPSELKTNIHDGKDYTHLW